MRKLLLFALSCLSYTAYCQVTPDQVSKALDSFAFMHPQEKVYVHSDRDIFTAGETLWFKAYVTLDGRPTNLSKVVYAELANSKGQLLAKRMLRAENGSAAGEITLSDTLSPGTYSLNVYTLWMLNFPGFIFKKDIVVYNADPKKKSSAPSTDISVQFLPEGGNLVAGLESRVAFKAVDASGMPLSVQGTIVDSKKNTVASFAAAHDGMDAFTFTPAANETYNAVIGSKTFKLPAAQGEGIVMTVNNDNPNRIFVQFNRAEVNKEKYNQLLVVAQTNYEVVYTGKVDFDAELTAAAINKKNFPPGILHITAMTMNGTPLAERLVFINNMELPSQQLSLDTVNTSARKKNFYTIDLSGFQNVSASASVVNADASLNTQDNIVTSLLLTSDLKGYVHDPAFYFRNKDTSTTRALDLLLMTQGWRRFKWESVVKYDHPALKFPFETGISVKGTLTGANGKRPVPKGKIELITKAEDSTTILSTATVNDKNEFAVYDLDFRKGATVYYQGTNLDRTNALVHVNIQPAYFDTVARSKAWPDVNVYVSLQPTAFWNTMVEEKTRVDSLAKTLAAVTVTAKRRSPLDSLNQLYATTIFQNSDQTLVMDSNAHYQNLWQYLRRSVPGITIQNYDTGTFVYFGRYEGLNVFSEGGAGTVQFFLNELPVETQIIETLDPGDVGIIKVFKGNTANILGTDRGAIAIYTRKGVSTRDWRRKGFDAFKLSGYSVVREFYNPVRPMQGDAADWRPTLYWNPDLQPGTNGKAVISFYNDDVAKRFKVIVQGIDKNGKLLNIEKTVQ